jgi:hypothetical protein
LIFTEKKRPSIIKKITVVSYLVSVFAVVFQANAQVDSNFHIYLLFGQSNMAGGCNGSTAKPESIDRKDTDCDTMSRVKVMAFTNCTNAKSYPCESLKLNRQHNKWYSAFPPYHNCGEGIGPADYFGKTLLDSIRADISIGFIPCALSGVDIDFFRKNIKSKRRSEFTIPPDNHWDGAYEWMIEKCKLAQQTGVIKGILFHQGESDKNNPAWVGKVAEIVKDLRTDLKLGEMVPFLAGEVLRTGDCASHNTDVAKVPDSVPNSYVISAEGLAMRPGDTYRLHFSCESVRTFGKRYATAFLKAADNNFVPRKDTTFNRKLSPAKKILNPTGLKSWGKDISVYSLNGSAVGKVEKSDKDVLSIKSSSVYIVKASLNNGSTAIVPFIQN